MAAPVMVILAVQTLVMVLYASFVTYTFYGPQLRCRRARRRPLRLRHGCHAHRSGQYAIGYRAFRPSHKAFLIVPMVGVFFIDLVNVAILKIFINFLH